MRRGSTWQEEEEETEEREEKMDEVERKKADECKHDLWRRKQHLIVEVPPPE